MTVTVEVAQPVEHGTTKVVVSVIVTDTDGSDDCHLPQTSLLVAGSVVIAPYGIPLAVAVHFSHSPVHWADEELLLLVKTTVVLEEEDVAATGVVPLPYGGVNVTLVVVEVVEIVED